MLINLKKERTEIYIDTQESHTLLDCITCQNYYLDYDEIVKLKYTKINKFTKDRISKYPNVHLVIFFLPNILKT